LAYHGEVVALDVDNFCGALGADHSVVAKHLASEGIQIVSYEVPEFKPYYLQARAEVSSMARVAKLQNLHARTGRD
jgi:hypothetical protein